MQLSDEELGIIWQICMCMKIAKLLDDERSNGVVHKIGGAHLTGTLKCLMSRNSAATVVKTARFVRVTPFGSPVVPEVYMIVQMLSRVPGVASHTSLEPPSTNLFHIVTGTPVF